MNSEPNPTLINTELVMYRFDQIMTELAGIKKEYVTKSESAELRHEIIQLGKDLATYKEANSQEISAIKKRNNFLSWAYPTLTAVLTAVLTFFILRFFQNYK